MRFVFIIAENEQKELKNYPFQDEVRDMQKFFKNNIKVLGENLEFIAESVNVTVGGTYREIDILALDTEQRVPVIIELKKDEANEEVLLQVLRYASWVVNNPDSVRYLLMQREELKRYIDDVNFDNVRIIIVAERFKDLLLSLSQYISGFQIDFGKYGRYIREDKNEQIIIIEYIKPPEELSRPVRDSMRIEDFNTYIEEYRRRGVREEYLEIVRKSYEYLMDLISERGWDITLRLNEWYIAFQIRGPVWNIYEIHIRMNNPPWLAIRLGDDFNPEEVGLSVEVFNSKFRQCPYGGFWRTDLTSPDDIKQFEKLLEHSYKKYYTST